MLKIFAKMFAVDQQEEYVPVKHIKPENQEHLEMKRQAAIEYLGDKWILKNQIKRKSNFNQEGITA